MTTLLKGCLLSIVLVIAFVPLSFPADPDEMSIDLKGTGMKIKQGQYEFGIAGALMWDFDHYDGLHRHQDQDDSDWISHSELRRLRINLSGRIGDDWRAKLQLDFSDSLGNVDVDDALITYAGWDLARIHIGQTKEPFGLENLTSSKNTTFVERSMVTNAFSPGRQPGIGLSGRVKKQLTWSLGVYEATSSQITGDTYAVTGRITYAPWLQKESFVHLGVAASSRDLDGTIYRIDETAEVHSAREFVDSAEITAEGVVLLGLEMAAGWGPFSLQAEYMQADVDARIGDDAGYSGYYVQASYFITGEKRPYRRGEFRRVKPEGKHGAVELAARYSELDARDNQEGIDAINTVLGITYYINKRIRLMANYIATRLEEDGGTEDADDADAVSLRLQFVL